MADDGWLSRIARKGVAAVGPGEQAEGEQQRQRAEARHDDIDVARAQVLAQPVVRHHQRPGRQRHELPGEQEGEGVVGEDHQVHAGEEQRIERQHALRRLLVLAVAERVEAGGGAAEIDDDQKERRERVEAEMRAEPRKPDRQPQDLVRGLPEQVSERRSKGRQRDQQRRRRRPRCGRARARCRASESAETTSRMATQARTTVSAISRSSPQPAWLPAVSIASLDDMSEPALPPWRIPSLASIRPRKPKNQTISIRYMVDPQEGTRRPALRSQFGCVFLARSKNAVMVRMSCDQSDGARAVSWQEAADG